MSNPTRDSKGHLVWKPQVGIFAKGAERSRESYGGIVGAFQDLAVEEGLTSKSYPHNFAGIIAAIQDLALGTQGPPVTPAPNPGGGAIDIDGNWIELVPPRVGDLWFDTRQGRLFVYVNDEWVQTNGADGLAAITEDDTPPVLEDTPAPGQFWYNKGANELYIHDGVYINSNGAAVPPNTPGAGPRWRVVNVDPDQMIQTTATLPLANTGPRSALDRASGYVITPPNLFNFNTQQDFNWWSFSALLELEEEIVNKSDVIISDTAPTDPDILKPGILWYDTESLDLSIYYADGDSAQWVPVSTPYTYDEDLDVIRRDLSNETRQRETSVQGIYQALNNLDIASNGTVQTIQSTIATAQQKISALETANYITKTEADADHAELAQQIAAIVIPPAPDLSPYAKTSAVSALTTKVNALPTQAALSAVANAIPDVGSFVKQYDIDQAIAGITVDYLPRNGGTVNGSFIVNKTDFNSPAMDFSSSPASSNQAFKFQTLGSTPNNFNTYGTTNNLWEQAWQFASDEDFCWIYNDTNKVFSITKEGPACSQLYIGDFGTNNNNGRVITNRIDVRDRLTAYQSAFEQVRQAVSSSTDFDSLKAGLLTALANV